MSFREQPNATVTTTAVWPGLQLNTHMHFFRLSGRSNTFMNGEFDPGSG